MSSGRHESCQYQHNVKVQAININKARVLFMQTRYWERPLLLVSREALAWHLIICLVSIRCWGRAMSGIMNIIASFLISLETHREINFPFKRINSDVAWALSFPLGSRVFRFWGGEWVTALMSQDASWPRLISADMFWIFWQCCRGLWLHSWPGRYISRYQGSLLRIMIIVTHIVPVRWLWRYLRGPISEATKAR